MRKTANFREKPVRNSQISGLRRWRRLLVGGCGGSAQQRSVFLVLCHQTALLVQQNVDEVNGLLQNGSLQNETFRLIFALYDQSKSFIEVIHKIRIVSLSVALQLL